LEEYLANCTDSQNTTEIKDMLYLAKSSSTKGGMFTYKMILMKVVKIGTKIFGQKD